MSTYHECDRCGKVMADTPEAAASGNPYGGDGREDQAKGFSVDLCNVCFRAVKKFIDTDPAKLPLRPRRPR